VSVDGGSDRFGDCMLGYCVSTFEEVTGFVDV